MPNRHNTVAYDVTISEELRALYRVRGALAKLERGREERKPSPVNKPKRGVFERRRLRRDGQRPLTISVSELLTLRVDECSPAEASDGLHDGGYQTLSVYLKEDGTCLAQVCVEPPPGAAARPAYRLVEMRETSDLTLAVRLCQSDSNQHRSLQWQRGMMDREGQRLESSNELVKALAPFVEMS